MDDDDDIEIGGDEPSTPEADVSSRADVEEAIIKQKQDRGDPDSRRSGRGVTCVVAPMRG